MNRLTDAIRADHRDLQVYYDRLVNSDDPDEQTRFQNQLTWDLARHVVGEELVLFPALDKYLGPGEATQDRRQNQIVSSHLCLLGFLWSFNALALPNIRTGRGCGQLGS